MLKEVIATRFITPLREGGSLPGLVEADDLAAYVLKFTGAGQGRKTLVAEVVCGELARRLGLRVPRLVTVELDSVLGLGEPDQEVQDLLRSSGGTNLGMDFLSGALGFDPLAFPVDPAEAGRIVWFDALVNNVDRSWRNPNLLMHRGDLWLIDHGATMIWHHNWPSAEASARPYDASDHALARFRPDVAAAAAELAPLITAGLLGEVTAEIPDAWLTDEPGFDTPDALRRHPRTHHGGRVNERHIIRASEANERDVYEYALLRIVPRVERGECINAGVLVYCRAQGYVGARTHLDEARLLALDPAADVAGVRAALRAVEDVCGGGEAAGQAAHDNAGRRFRWLIAPRSTVVQPGPVHTGLTTDPAAETGRLLDLLVR
jgi:hypothetical protein